jgi:hypothetical protein
MKKLNSSPCRAIFALFGMLTLLPFAGHAQWTTPASGGAYIDGNVGIGVSSGVPEQKLTLQGHSLWLKIENTETSPTSPWYIGSSGPSWAVGGGKLVIGNTALSPDAALVIDGNKNVGIGQTSPSGASGSGINARLTVKGGVTNSDWNIKLQGSEAGAVDWIIGTSANGWVAGGGRFMINTTTATSSAQSPFTIVAATGNVGIGTTNPPAAYKLAVGGKAIAEEIVVKLQANWPDYVFENTYKLPPLLEVERYIRKNKHLPEVPSAQEVKENGLTLGEMNALLLKKVEELTLYMIESQKKVAELQKEVEALKAR